MCPLSDTEPSGDISLLLFNLASFKTVHVYYHLIIRLSFYQVLKLIWLIIGKIALFPGWKQGFRNPSACE